MGQLAFSAQGSKFYIESGSGGGISITDISQTNPAIVTAAAHGLSKGDVVSILPIFKRNSLGQIYGVASRTAGVFVVEKT